MDIIQRFLLSSRLYSTVYGNGDDEGDVYNVQYMEMGQDTEMAEGS